MKRKRNKDGHIVVKVPLSQELPQVTLKRKIGGTEYSISGSYDGKKIRAVMKSKGEAGEHLCTIPPYGYKKDSINSKKWILDEEAAATVKRIFSLCLEGYGHHKLAVC